MILRIYIFEWLYNNLQHLFFYLIEQANKYYSSVIIANVFLSLVLGILGTIFIVFMDKFLIYNIYMDRTQRCILTNICLVYDGEKILVVDRKKKDWPGLTFPGGHVEKDEDFNASVIREVKEETGLTIRNPILCGIEEFKTEKEDRYIMLYYKTDKFKGKLKKSDEGDVFWINRDELDSYKLSLDLKRILKVMESDNLSEIIYYRKEDKRLSKIV